MTTVRPPKPRESSMAPARDAVAGPSAPVVPTSAAVPGAARWQQKAPVLYGPGQYGTVCEVEGCQEPVYARVRWWDRIQGTREHDMRDFVGYLCVEHTHSLEADEEEGLTVVRNIEYLIPTGADARWLRRGGAAAKAAPKVYEYECIRGCHEVVTRPYWRTFGFRTWCEMCRAETLWRPEAKPERAAAPAGEVDSAKRLERNTR